MNIYMNIYMNIHIHDVHHKRLDFTDDKREKKGAHPYRDNHEYIYIKIYIHI